MRHTRRTTALYAAFVTLSGAPTQASAAELPVAQDWGSLYATYEGGMNIQVLYGRTGGKTFWFAKETRNYIDPRSDSRWIDGRRCPALLQVLQATTDLPSLAPQSTPYDDREPGITVSTHARFPRLEGDGVEARSNLGGPVHRWFDTQRARLENCWEPNQPHDFNFGVVISFHAPVMRRVETPTPPPAAEP